MTFWGHLEALRWTLIRIALVLVVLVIVLFIIIQSRVMVGDDEKTIFDLVILGPASPDFFLYRIFGVLGRLSFFPKFGDENFVVNLINTEVASQFRIHISTSLYLALVVALPYIIYEIWKFVRPALFPKEIKSVRLAFTMGGGMFYLGCALGYAIIFPFMFRFLAEYRVSETVVNSFNLSNYTGIFFMMILVMGILFELPLLAWILSGLKIIHRDMLKKARRYAIVILLTLAAVITPTGDPFTLMVMFLPLYLLYEFSILLVRKKPVEGEEEEEEEEEKEGGEQEEEEEQEQEQEETAEEDDEVSAADETETEDGDDVSSDPGNETDENDLTK